MQALYNSTYAFLVRNYKPITTPARAYLTRKSLQRYNKNCIYASAKCIFSEKEAFYGRLCVSVGYGECLHSGVAGWRAQGESLCGLLLRKNARSSAYIRQGATVLSEGTHHQWWKGRAEVQQKLHIRKRKVHFFGEAGLLWHLVPVCQPLPIPPLEPVPDTDSRRRASRPRQLSQRLTSPSASQTRPR